MTVPTEEVTDPVIRHIVEQITDAVSCLECAAMIVIDPSPGVMAVQVTHERNCAWFGPAAAGEPALVVVHSERKPS